MMERSQLGLGQFGKAVSVTGHFSDGGNNCFI